MTLRVAVLTTAVLLLTAAPATPRAQSAAAIKGTWTGTLTQRMTPDFTVTATIRSFNRYTARNPVSYGAPLNCKGRWRYLGRKGTTYRFRETITSGDSDTCKGTGTVSLTPNAAGDRLRYRFKGGGVESTGTLHHEH